MQGNQVVVLFSIAASELAIKNALEAIVNATNPWALMAVLLFAVYAMAHQAKIVLEGMRSHPRRGRGVAWGQRTRTLMTRILAALVEYVGPEPPRRAGRRNRGRDAL